MRDDKPTAPASEYMTIEEKAEAERSQLYMTHKLRGTLGTYYHLYPDERPRSPLAQRSEEREHEGRER